MTDRSHNDTEPPDSSSHRHQPETCVTLLQEAWRQAGALQAEGIPVLADSIPLLFFGRAMTARVATVGINPSYREFQEHNGQPVSPPRFYLPPSRYQDGELSVPEALKVCQSLHWYFRPENAHEMWFQWPEALLNGMGVSFKNGTAVHTDIESPLATQPNWGKLEEGERTRLAADGHILWRRILLQMPELRAIVGLGTDPSSVEAMGAIFDDEIDLSPLHLPPIRLGTWTPGNRTLTVYWWEKTWGQPREFFWKDGKSIYPAVGRCLVRRRPWDGGGRHPLPHLPVADKPSESPSFPDPCRDHSEMDDLRSDEQPLLKALDAYPRDRGILLALLKVYDAQNRQGDVIDRIESFLLQETDGDTRAHLRLLEGCAAEKLHNYHRARGYYEQGLAEECSTPVTRYFLRNNLGFCCNQLWDYRTAEQWCRQALEVDDRIPNAWKNLGIALNGQDRWLDAAWAFVGALRISPGYSPAWHELTMLMVNRSELRERDPDLARAFAQIWGTRRRGEPRREANENTDRESLDDMSETRQNDDATKLANRELVAAAFVDHFRTNRDHESLGGPEATGKIWNKAHIRVDDNPPLRVRINDDTTRDAALRFAVAILRDRSPLKIDRTAAGTRQILLREDTRPNGLYIYEIGNNSEQRGIDAGDPEG